MYNGLPACLKCPGYRIDKNHLQSVRHLQGRKIEALLAQNCLTLEEIGRRVGVTRQRIHQIAVGLGLWNGRERRHVCTLARMKERNNSELVDDLKRVCPLPVERIAASAPNRFLLELVLVAGRRCLLRQIGRNALGYWVLRGCMSDGSFRRNRVSFVLCRLKPGWWLVLKPERWTQTEFTLAPKDTRAQVSRLYHDWPALVNAWHLIKGGPRAHF